jgi:predicted phosphodiesterase
LSLYFSAFLGSDREKGREFLLNLFALAFGAGHFPFVVCGQCHDQAESLLALLADIFVLGHSHYPPVSWVMILAENAEP